MAQVITIEPKDVDKLGSLLPKVTSDFPFPKIIHQIWINDNPEVPNKWKESPKEWQRLHPEWKYLLWNGPLAEAFVKKYYPDFLKTYLAFPHFIQRVDAIRPLFLKQYGGLYSDLDIVPLQNIEKHITGSCGAYFVNSSYTKKGYTNALMASVQGSTIWDTLIQEMMKPPKWWAVTPSLEILYTTGPMMLTDVISNHDDVICRLPRVKFNPSHGLNPDAAEDPIAVVKSLEGCSWHKSDQRIASFIVRHKVLFLFLLILLILFVIYALFRYKFLYKMTVAGVIPTTSKRGLFR